MVYCSLICYIVYFQVTEVVIRGAADERSDHVAETSIALVLGTGNAARNLGHVRDPVRVTENRGSHAHCNVMMLLE